MIHTMNKSRSAIGVAFALALLTSAPLGAQQTAIFNLTGVNGENLAGVYTSPYVGFVGGGPTIPVICDDFSDNSYLPEEWTTYVTSLTTVDNSSSPLSYMKWSKANSGAGATSGDPITVGSTSYAGWNLTQGQAYTTAAILMLDILNLNNISNPTAQQKEEQEDYSFALWELFDPNAAAGAVGTGNANWGSNSDSVVPWLGTSYVGDLTNATKDLETAIGTSASALNGYAVTIYSYVSPANGGMTPECGDPLHSPCPSIPPQEFISVTPSAGMTYSSNPVPEPSSLAVLGVYFLFGGGSLLFFGRRRIFRTGN